MKKNGLSLFVLAFVLAVVVAFAFAPSNIAQAEGECPPTTCPAEEPATIEVPICTFDVFPMPVRVGIPVNFSYTGGQDGVAVAWLYDYEKSESGSDVVVVYTGTGKKTVFMTVERRGVSTTCYKTIWVEEGVEYQAPTEEPVVETTATPASDCSITISGSITNSDVNITSCSDEAETEIEQEEATPTATSTEASATNVVKTSVTASSGSPATTQKVGWFWAPWHALLKAAEAFFHYLDEGIFQVVLVK